MDLFSSPDAIISYSQPLICHLSLCSLQPANSIFLTPNQHQPPTSQQYFFLTKNQHQLQPAEQSNSTCIRYTEQMGGLIIQTGASHNLTNFMCTASPLDLNMTSIFGKVSENQTLQKFFQTESKFSDACSVFILATSSTESCLTYNGTRL